jgi:hypothetical protein
MRSFGPKVPPVHVLLKRILDSYPDGQIFKVRHVVVAFIREGNDTEC